MPWPTTYPFFHVDQPEQVDNAALLRRLQRPGGPGGCGAGYRHL